MNEITIDRLLKDGWKFKFFRYHNINREAMKRDDMKLIPYRFIKKLLHKFSMGGKVVVEIIPPRATFVFSGEWICHPLRKFDKNKGFNLAFEKALQKAGVRFK